jgi:hypothetical protein
LKNAILGQCEVILGEAFDGFAIFVFHRNALYNEPRVDAQGEGDLLILRGRGEAKEEQEYDKIHLTPHPALRATFSLQEKDPSPEGRGCREAAGEG